MGTIKDRNGMDLTEAEDIKKRWQEYTEDKRRKKKKEYTEELHKKDLYNPDNHDGVITHLEPDIKVVHLCKLKYGQIFVNETTGTSLWSRASLVAQTGKHLSAMQETRV